ncbi:hypothetical protein AB1Y20_008282 [Prymnesium parvum]|uniref:Fanconi-associated nuclease n=1 Tax=Prymnesium parvum TaxID=97485 RepID=A0AB34IW45_PRYPA
MAGRKRSRALASPANRSPARRDEPASRFGACPICGVTVPLFKINEARPAPSAGPMALLFCRVCTHGHHLDGHVEPQSQSTLALPVHTEGSHPSASHGGEPASRGGGGSSSEAAGRSTHTRTSTTPLARAFGIATPATPDIVEKSIYARRALASFMPAYSNRLKDRSYPGAGRREDGAPSHCDPRRQNSWMIYPRAARTRRVSAAAALAAVASTASRETELLSAEEVSIAERVSRLSHRCQLACALAFEEAGGWAAVSGLDLEETAAEGEDTPAEDGAHGLAEAVDAGLLRALDLAAIAQELPALLPVLSRLKVASLRELLATYCLTPPPALAPSPKGTTDASPAAPTVSRGPSGATALPSASEHLASHLVSYLRRRRAFDVGPLASALGPCVAMPSNVVEALHRSSLVFFCSAGYCADEAALMLRGLTPIPQLRPDVELPMGWACGSGGVDGDDGTDRPIGRTVHPCYASRDELLRVERCIQVADEAEAAGTDGSLLCADASRGSNDDSSAVPASWEERLESALLMLTAADHPVGSMSICRVIDAGCAQLRRLKRAGESVRVLRAALQVAHAPPRWRAGAWVALLRDLQTTGHMMAALRMCEGAHTSDGFVPIDSQSTPVVTLSRYQLLVARRTLRKLAVPPRRWKKPQLPEMRTAKEVRMAAKAVVTSSGPYRRAGWVAPGGTLVSVEELVLSRARAAGYTIALHTENALFLALFSMLLWDAIFLPLPGAFSSRYQDCPHDLIGECGAFYTRRETTIEQILQLVRRGEAPSMLARSHEANYGQCCIGLDWSRFDVQTLQTIVEGLGGDVVATICLELARDFSGMSHGAPDLLLVRVEESTAGASCRPSAKLVEVKGPGDKLSEKQQVWIDILLQSGANVEVCYVDQEPQA